MDKSWATLNPFIEDYRTGLAKFISNSLEVSSHDGNINCLCAKCLNRLWLSNNEVEAHLIIKGPLLEDIFLGPSGMGGMLINNHIGQEALIPAYAREFQAMVQDASTELYSGCGMMKMDFFVQVFQNKCLYGCSESTVQANL
ncbi:hypothetical protein ACFX1T_013085 [Malus domestica]